MQSSVILVTVVLFVTAAMAAPDKPHYDLNNAPQLFEKFVQEHHRRYLNAADREKHYQAFVNALKDIDAKNDDPTDSAFFDINEFADYTPDEMKHMTGLNIGDGGF